jgi:outer membrane protein TolC
MFNTRGAQPRLFRPDTTAKRLCRATLIVLALVASASVQAADEAPLTLDEAERLALQDEPGHDVFLARADALDEQSLAVGQLPDPQLRAGVVNFPIESGNFRTEGMTQAVIGLKQAIPRGQTRSLRTSQLQSLSDGMRAQAQARSLDVRTSARQAWLDVYYWENARNVVTEIRPFFSDLVVVVRSLYSVGARDQQDLLRAKLELSRVDDRLIDMTSQIARARAVLAEWVGPENSSRPLHGSLPLSDVPALPKLLDKLVSHPLLQAADARIGASGDGIFLAEQGYKTAWAVEVNYGYRDGHLADGSSRSDFISAMVTFDLPIFASNRQDRTLEAARREKRATISSKTGLHRELRKELESKYVTWEDLKRRVDFYDELIVPQARDYAQASLAAYQSDTTDFADVMKGRITELDVRLDHLRLSSEREKTYAILANLGGIE